MTSEVNVMGTIKLLTAAAQAKVKRLVYAASSSAYGEKAAEVKTEALLPQPLSPYAAAKLAGEYFCQAFSQSMGLEAVGLRYFNVFGPRQDPKSQYSAVIPLFTTAVIEGRQPTVYGDGQQTRDFTFVENNVRANILAATTKNPVAGKVINVACGTSYSLLDLLRVINEALGKDVQPIFAPARVGDVKHSLADIQMARELLGYDVFVDFDEGMKRTVAWYLENKNAWD
jgi:nucleoside-diphosphate-sugar epimerase